MGKPRKATVTKLRAKAPAKPSRFFMALPEPHRRVSFGYHPNHPDMPPRNAIVTYSGYPGDLLAAGVAEPSMFLGARTCGSGIDSVGFNYVRHGSKSGRQKITRYIESSTLAISLPGVSQFPSCVPESIRWLNSHPGEIHATRNANGAEEITGTEDALLAEGFIEEQHLKDLGAYWCDIRLPDYEKTRLYRSFEYLVLVRKLTYPEAIFPTARDFKKRHKDHMSFPGYYQFTFSQPGEDKLRDSIFGRRFRFEDRDIQRFTSIVARFREEMFAAIDQATPTDAERPQRASFLRLAVDNAVRP